MPQGTEPHQSDWQNQGTDGAARGLIQDDALQLRRLRWRARRGLLENDVLLTRFFDRYQDQLSAEQIHALDVLLEQPDNELLDLFLARTELTGSANIPAVRAVLALIQSI